MNPSILKGFRILNKNDQEMFGRNVVMFYQLSRTSEWTEQINKTILEALRVKSSFFKYCVTSSILEKKGTGFHVNSAALWDNEKDGFGIMFKI